MSVLENRAMLNLAGREQGKQGKRPEGSWRARGPVTGFKGEDSL